MRRNVNFTKSNNNNILKQSRKYCIHGKQVTLIQWYYDSIMNYARKAIKYGWNKIRARGTG